MSALCNLVRFAGGLALLCQFFRGCGPQEFPVLDLELGPNAKLKGVVRDSWRTRKIAPTRVRVVPEWRFSLYTLGHSSGACVVLLRVGSEGDYTWYISESFERQHRACSPLQYPLEKNVLVKVVSRSSLPGEWTVFFWRVFQLLSKIVELCTGLTYMKWATGAYLAFRPISHLLASVVLCNVVQGIFDAIVAKRFSMVEARNKERPQKFARGRVYPNPVSLSTWAQREFGRLLQSGV